MFENNFASHIGLVHNIDDNSGSWLPSTQFVEWLDSISVNIADKEETE